MKFEDVQHVFLSEGDLLQVNEVSRDTIEALGIGIVTLADIPRQAAADGWVQRILVLAHHLFSAEVIVWPTRDYRTFNDDIDIVRANSSRVNDGKTIKFKRVHP